MNVVVEAEDVVTLPLATTSCMSESCTSITSPGFSIAALSPVLNVIVSFSNFSVNK